MNENGETMYAVLTGDIVKSSNLSIDELQSVKDFLKKASEELNRHDDAPIAKGKIEFYRGDSWQLLLTKPQYALWASLFLRAYIKAHTKTDTRIAVGIGQVSNLDINNISQSMGKAFELSGTSLDKLKGRKRMTAAIPYYLEKESDWLISIFELCDAIVQKWTPVQSEAIFWSLLQFKSEEIAEIVVPPKNPKNVGKSLRASGWYVLESVLERTKRATESLILSKTSL